MRVSGSSYVIARSEGRSDLQDIRISTTAQGLNLVEIARNPADTSRRIYVVDRRLLPFGVRKKLLEVTAFNDDSSPEDASEVRAMVEWEEIPNVWDLPVERTWGLPEGMESPWVEPLEMVGNELLLSIETRFVSGDAPVSIAQNDSYQNGKYRVTVGNDVVAVSTRDGRLIGSLRTNTSHLAWTDGTAGAASFRGGSIFVEPAKPPLFQGEFILEEQPEFVSEGLYKWRGDYIISSTSIINARGVGAIAFISDPYPERWVRRMFGRAYVSMVTPAFVPPLEKDRPRRVGVEVQLVDNDFPELRPVVTTPYADKTGVFNAWALETPAVVYDPREAPYDVLIPFEQKLDEWGGYSIDYPGVFVPANDFRGEAHAAFPSPIGYEMPDLPPMEEGTVFFRWKDSGWFHPVTTEWMSVGYREGYFYFDNKISPESNGIARIIPSSGWNNTKIEWTRNNLFVNDVPALVQEKRWQDTYFDDPAGVRKWGEVLGIPASEWSIEVLDPYGDEMLEELPPTWETGSPEGEVEVPPPDYSLRPRTWGRVLYEGYPEE